MLSPRGILHLGFFVGISILWMSSLVKGGNTVHSPHSPLKSPKSPKSPSKSPESPERYLSPSPTPTPQPQVSPKSSASLNPPCHHLPLCDIGPNFSIPSVRNGRLNKGKKVGLLLASVAGLLQVVVVIYLLVKRKKLLRVVEKYEV